MRLIFCSDPLNPRQPDPAYDAEVDPAYDAEVDPAGSLGIEYGLISYEALVDDSALGPRLHIQDRDHGVVHRWPARWHR